MTTRYTAAAVGAALAMVLAACGSTGGSSTAGPSSGAPAFATDFRPPASGCGSFPTPAPADPDGVIAALPTEQRDALNGYTNFPNSTIKIVKSAWQNWKPSHAPPYRVSIVWGQVQSDFQVQITDDMKAQLEKAGIQVDLRTTGNNLDLPQQIQLYNAAAQSNPDLIILEPVEPDVFLGPIDKAAAQGIPTATLLGFVSSKNAVNLDSNTYQAAGTLASYTAKLLKGQGTLLYVQGIATTEPDLQSVAAWDQVVKHCPGLKVASGRVYGGFSDSIAKSEMLKYLATHPQKLDAVLEVAVMAPGVMRAFQQTGRSMPIVPDSGLEKASLGYWNQNKATYHDVGSIMPPVPAARAVVDVVRRMFDGQGLKMNGIVGKAPVVTDANLGDWVDPSWNLNTPGAAPGDPQSFLPSKYLEAFFEHPKPLK
jgi:ribose transport system substrate-binding protein